MASDAVCPCDLEMAYNGRRIRLRRLNFRLSQFGLIGVGSVVLPVLTACGNNAKLIAPRPGDR